MPVPDPYGLTRFVDAQAAVHGQVLAELAAGRKRSHWMWFVFPQLAGLGRSETARHFGIVSIGEAQAYHAHPLLGPRLAECCGLLLRLPSRSASEVLGSPDDLKLRSSMTLFDQAAPDDPVFGRVLRHFFDGQADDATLALLAREPRAAEPPR